MFTGIIEALGVVQSVEERPPGRRLTIQAGNIAEGVSLGDSVAISGCCLTVVAINGSSLEFDAGPETLSRTILGRFSMGDTVNLERAVRVGDRLGGHFVSGHVDAVGTLVQRDDAKDWSTFWIQMPAPLRTQMASKGSVAVDGVSLTLVEVESDRFSVQLIPHTLAITTLGRLKVGDQVNLETDLLAKYVEAGLHGRS
ncbi:MAG: riboflavin synthase [Planctomycetes bacterium]|nr:riboflavin synthase [Planctomycetota bacterium]